MVEARPGLAAIVLAGGAARRMGGTAKPTRTVGGVSLLDRVLTASAAAYPRVVVGPGELRRHLPAGVALTSEDPPRAGPVAALAAGLAVVARLASEPRPRLVALLAADLPFLTSAVIDNLAATVAATPDQDGAILTDDTGRRQWLTGVWRIDAVAAALRRLGDPNGRSMAQLAAGLRVVAVSAPPPVPGHPPAWFDCDTEAALRQAELLLPVQEWSDGDVG